MTHRHVAFVLLGGFFSLACILVGTTFAEPSDLTTLAKEFSQDLEKAQVHTVIVSDFVRDEGGVSLQGVLLADRFWFALLQSERGFRTLNRDLLRARKDEREAANAAGAEVLITGKIRQDTASFVITITASNVSSGKRLEQRSASLPGRALWTNSQSNPFGQKGRFTYLGRTVSAHLLAFTVRPLITANRL